MAYLFDTVIRYLLQMSVLAVPAAVIFTCFFPYRHKALTAMGLQSGISREIGLAIFVMTIFGILAVTLKPAMVWERTPGVWGNVTLYIDRPNYMTNVNLTPFYMLRIYKAFYGLGDVLYIIVNFLGNMLVFLPLGFFPALLFRQESWWRSALTGCCVSFFVEWGQYFLLRQSDVDDVILNTLGGLLGYLLFCFIPKKWKN
jgi:glycopeptide antibiotics resistance protein